MYVYEHLHVFTETILSESILSFKKVNLVVLMQMDTHRYTHTQRQEISVQLVRKKSLVMATTVIKLKPVRHHFRG